MGMGFSITGIHSSGITLFQTQFVLSVLYFFIQVYQLIMDWKVEFWWTRGGILTAKNTETDHSHQFFRAMLLPEDLWYPQNSGKPLVFVRCVICSTRDLDTPIHLPRGWYALKKEIEYCRYEYDGYGWLVFVMIWSLDPQKMQMVRYFWHIWMVKLWKLWGKLPFWLLTLRV